MLESGSSGSVRGVPSNGHPYRDPGSGAVLSSPAHCRSTFNCGSTVTLPKAAGADAWAASDYMPEAWRQMAASAAY